METVTEVVNIGDLRVRLQSSFARLTSKQQEWLLTRRDYNTDTDCSQALGYSNKTGPQANWKRTGVDFREAYGLIINGALEGADALIVEALSNANGLRALIEERKILDMSWEDVSDAKLGGMKSTAVKEAVNRVKPAKHVTEHVFTVEEVRRVIDAEVIGIN